MSEKMDYCSECGARQREESSLVLGKDLRVLKYRNGEKIPYALTSEEWLEFGENKIGAYSCITDEEEKLFYLYNWYAVNDARGLAPGGWRIPTHEEWFDIERPLRENASYAGHRDGYHSGYYGVGYHSYFWSSTESKHNIAYGRSLYCYNRGVRQTYLDKRFGCSVYCVKEK